MDRLFHNESQRNGNFFGIPFQYATHELVFEGFDNCDTCPKHVEFGHAVVIDFTQESISSNLELFLKNLIEFQEELLENIFFGFDDNRKYNLYLYLVVDSSMLHRQELRTFQSNLDYAKKRIVSKDSWGNEKEETDASVELQRLYSKYQMSKAGYADALKNLKHSYDFAVFLKGSGHSYPKEFLNILTLDSYIRAKKTYQDESSELRTDTDGADIDERRNRWRKSEKVNWFLGNKKNDEKLYSEINFVSSVDFARLDERDSASTVDFARVNLFLGNNGAGKTSILEAVEKAITGYTKHFRGMQYNPVVTYRNKQGKEFEWCASSSEDGTIREIIKRWYDFDCPKSKDGSAEYIIEFNKQFHRYNYVNVPYLTSQPPSEGGKLSSSQAGGASGLLFSAISLDPEYERMKVFFRDLSESVEGLSRELARDEEEIERHVKVLDGKPWRDEGSESRAKKRQGSVDSYIEKIQEDVPNFLGLFSEEAALKTLTFSRLHEYLRNYLRALRLAQSTLKVQREGAKKAIRELEELYQNSLERSASSVEEYFLQLVASPDFSRLKYSLDYDFVAMRLLPNQEFDQVPYARLSVGELACLRLAMTFSVPGSKLKIPNILLLDEPTAHLDDAHILNLFDVLRKMVFSGKQIFFTTKDPRVASIFRRKFSFLGEDFNDFSIRAADNQIHVSKKTFGLLNKSSDFHEEEAIAIIRK